MEKGQRTPYISDIASYQLKPIFLAGTIIAIGTFQATYSIILDRIFHFVLRRGHRDTADIELALAIAIVVLTTLGVAGAVLLALFDKATYQRAHQVFLAMFL